LRPQQRCRGPRNCCQSKGLEAKQQEEAECRTSKVGRKLFGDTKQGDEAATGRVEEEAVESEAGGNETREKLSLTLNKSRQISTNLEKSRKVSINVNKICKILNEKVWACASLQKAYTTFLFLFCF
jgi:hypothetical protein